MAKKNQDGDPTLDTTLTDSSAPTDGVTAPLIAVVDVTEAQPQRGGSYTRNPDGTLQQTEGHGFADPESTKE